MTIREIRRALNEFRDNQRLGIVHTRNRLMASIFVTGFFTYALLCTAVLLVTPANLLYRAAKRQERQVRLGSRTRQVETVSHEEGRSLEFLPCVSMAQDT